MLVDLLVVAMASAFLVSFISRWLDHPLIRGGLAAVIGAVGAGVFGYDPQRGVFFALASGFLCLLFILLGERLATPPAMVVDSRRRGF